jgi:hypothetical protein
MSERYRLVVTQGSQQLVRLVEGREVVVGYLDGRYAPEIVDTLNAVPIGHLQKQVAIMGDMVADILGRVTKLGKETR